jgi:tRNA threonylcarbamoyl adenosine modification protein YeaZ
MKILALEFSSLLRSVAVVREGRVRGRASEQGSRDTKAFALIDSAIREAALSRDEIECVAVGLGPGSYAGIRIAIAIAQGWRLARGVKLLGVSSADCVAAQLHERGTRGVVNVAIDAQRGELFASRYELGSEWRKLSDFALVTRPVEGELVVRPDVDTQVAPDAATLATLAASREHFVEASQLEPIYLRKAEFVKAPPARIIGL